MPRGADAARQPERHGAGLVARARLDRRSSLLPGPPREMMPMFEAVVRERLAPRGGGAALFRRVLKITGRSESDVDARGAAGVRAVGRRSPCRSRRRFSRSLGQIELHLTARAPVARGGRCRRSSGRWPRSRAMLGDALYSVDGRTLEVVVGDLLRERRADDRARGVVHGRAAGVAADRRARQLGLRRARRRLLQQRDEDRAGSACRRR